MTCQHSIGLLLREVRSNTVHSLTLLSPEAVRAGSTEFLLEEFSTPLRISSPFIESKDRLQTFRIPNEIPIAKHPNPLDFAGNASFCGSVDDLLGQNAKIFDSYGSVVAGFVGNPDAWYIDQGSGLKSESNIPLARVWADGEGILSANNVGSIVTDTRNTILGITVAVGVKGEYCYVAPIVHYLETAKKDGLDFELI